jgi:dephospho-CoA kinase
MLIIGLTGGIGSGKSTVSQLFANLGVPIIDTDTIAHELVSPGQNALVKIVAAFGKQILTPEGELNRAHLRELVFRDQKKREALEGILHPLIKQAVFEQIRKLEQPYCILVVPLLVEKGWYTMVDRVLVVDTPAKLQRQRVKQRSGLNDDQIDAILSQQASREQRLAYADDVIVNDQSLQHMEIEVNHLHRKYQDISRQAIDTNKL